MLGGIAIAMMMGQSQCNISTPGMKVVEAQKFIIRDASGKSRAELSETGFILQDDKGTQISLFSNGNTVEMFLLGSAGRVELRAGPTAYLFVADNEFKTQTYVRPAGVNLLYNKKQRAELEVDAFDSYLRFYDKNGQPPPQLEMTARTGLLRRTD